MISLWNTYQTNYVVYKSDFLVAFMYAFDNWISKLQSYKHYNYFYNEYTVTPPEYKGPTMGPSYLSYTIGYGLLTAGHLDLTKSDKSFGTLGQGIAADQSNYMQNKNEGVVDYWINNVNGNN